MRFIRAVSHGGPMPGPPRLLVIHDAETPLERGYAVSIAANWFGRSASTSAHYILDPGDCVQMLPDTVIAWHCGTGNLRSLGFEQAGYARFSRAEWTTPDGLSQLRQLAGLLAAKAAEHDIPIRWASDEQILDGHRGGAGGLATHDDMRRVLGGTTHTDPTPGYPRDLLLRFTLAAARGKTPTPTPPAPTPTAATDDVAAAKDEDDMDDTQIEKLATAIAGKIRGPVGGGVIDALRTEEARHLISVAVQDAITATRPPATATSSGSPV